MLQSCFLIFLLQQDKQISIIYIFTLLLTCDDFVLGDNTEYL